MSISYSKLDEVGLLRELDDHGAQHHVSVGVE